MAQVRINPKAKLWPYLEAGKYGPGTENPTAECEVMAHEQPAQDNPPYDVEGKRGPYTYWHIQVRQPDAGLVNIRQYESAGENSGSRTEGWLINLGVAVADDGTYDDGAVPGRKCIVVTGEPRVDKDNKDKKYTSLKDLIGTP